MIKKILLPKTKTGWFETTINIDGNVIKIEAMLNTIFNEWRFTITDNDITISDLHPKSAMPMNYGVSLLQKFLYVPINAFNCNPIGKIDEFNNGINTLFIVDMDGYKELLSILGL